MATLVIPPGLQHAESPVVGLRAGREGVDSLSDAPGTQGAVTSGRDEQPQPHSPHAPAMVGCKDAEIGVNVQPNIRTTTGVTTTGSCAVDARGDSAGARSLRETRICCERSDGVENAQATSEETSTSTGFTRETRPHPGIILEVDESAPEPEVSVECSRKEVESKVHMPGTGMSAPPSDSEGDANGTTTKRKGLRSMLSAAFMNSLDEPGVKRKTSTDDGRWRSPRHSFSLKRSPPSRRHSSTSLLSTSSAISVSSRSIHRGNSSEASRAVRAIQHRVKKRDEKAKQSRTSSVGDDEGCGGCSENDDNACLSPDSLSDDGNNSDSDCDVSCDLQVVRQRAQLAERKRDIDSALMWLKYELRQLREQDEELVQTFHQLRHGIFLLRQHSNSRSLRRHKKMSLDAQNTMGGQQQMRSQRSMSLSDERPMMDSGLPYVAGRPSLLGVGVDGVFRRRLSSASQNSLWQVEEVSSLPSSPVCQRPLTKTFSGSTPCVDFLSSDEEDSGASVGHFLRLPSGRRRRSGRWQVLSTSGSEELGMVRRRSSSIGSEAREGGGGGRRASTQAVPLSNTTYKELKKQAMMRYVRKQSMDASDLTEPRFLSSSPGNSFLQRPFSAPGSPHDTCPDFPSPVLTDLLPGTDSKDVLKPPDTKDTLHPLPSRLRRSRRTGVSPLVSRQMNLVPTHEVDEIDGDTQSPSSPDPQPTSPEAEPPVVTSFSEPVAMEPSPPNTASNGITGDVVDEAAEVQEFQSSATSFANSTFNETDASQKPGQLPEVFYPTVAMPSLSHSKVSSSTLPRSFRHSRRTSREFSSLTQEPTTTSAATQGESPEQSLANEIYSMINNSMASTNTEHMLNRRYSQLSDDGDCLDPEGASRASSRRNSLKDKRRLSWAFGGGRRSSNTAELDDEVPPDVTFENRKALHVLGVELGAHHRRESMQFFNRDDLEPSSGGQSPTTSEKTKTRKVSRWRKDSESPRKDPSKAKRLRQKRHPDSVTSPIAEQGEQLSPTSISAFPTSLSTDSTSTITDEHISTPSSPLWASPTKLLSKPPLLRSKPSDVVLDEKQGDRLPGRPRKQSLPASTSLSGGIHHEASDVQSTLSESPTSPTGTLASEAIPEPEPGPEDTSLPPSVLVTPASPNSDTAAKDADSPAQVRRSRSKAMDRSSTGFAKAVGKLRRTLVGGRNRAQTTGSAVKIVTRVGKVGTEYETVQMPSAASLSSSQSREASPGSSMTDISGDSSLPTQSLPSTLRRPKANTVIGPGENQRLRSYTSIDYSGGRLDPTASLPHNLPPSSFTLPPMTMSLASPMGGYSLGSSAGSDVFLGSPPASLQDNCSLSTISAHTNDEDDASADLDAETTQSTVLYV